MPEGLLVWIVVASFGFGIISGAVIAYARGLMRRKFFTFLPFNRHIRIVRHKAIHRQKQA